MQKALEWIAQQRFGLDPHDTPEEQVGYWSRLATEYRAVAARALKEPEA